MAKVTHYFQFNEEVFSYLPVHIKKGLKLTKGQAKRLFSQLTKIQRETAIVGNMCVQVLGEYPFMVNQVFVPGSMNRFSRGKWHWDKAGRFGTRKGPVETGEVELHD